MAERWVKVAAAPDESVALLMDGVLKDAGIIEITDSSPDPCATMQSSRSRGPAMAKRGCLQCRIAVPRALLCLRRGSL